jgi:hypothetical protein
LFVVISHVAIFTRHCPLRKRQPLLWMSKLY